MANDSGIVATLISGGLGATIGGIITAGIQLFGRRSEAKATAADLITKAAGSMVDRLEVENRELRDTITELREYIAGLIELDPELPAKIDPKRRTAKRRKDDP